MVATSSFYNEYSIKYKKNTFAIISACSNFKKVFACMLMSCEDATNGYPSPVDEWRFFTVMSIVDMPRIFSKLEEPEEKAILWPKK